VVQPASGHRDGSVHGPDDGDGYGDGENDDGGQRMTAITVTGLTKSFGDHVVLDELNLTVAAGSLTVVLGPSGSGKTTLLRILAGFERADTGSITIGDEVVDGGDGRRFVAPKRRSIGYVTQEGALFPHLTVAKNVGFGLRRGPQRTQRVAELLDMVGLADLGHRYPHQLSGGQQQRVALARTLAVAPSLVLLDEPFASLDAGLRASVRADVRRILREAETTALLVAHDQDEALSWADVVAVLRDGRITAESSPREIYARPTDAGTASFVGVANLIDGTAEGASVVTAFGAVSLLPESTPFAGPTPVVVLVRPEQLQVELGATAPGLPGLIVDVQFYGHDIVVTVAPDKPCGADTVIARASGGLAADIGAPVTLTVTEPVHAWAKGASTQGF
jgi:iron(III) transport system ATP-binding protein